VPFRDQPDLQPSPDDPPAGRPFKVQRRSEVWVPFADGTLRSCRVVEWRQDRLGWWCLLAWGVSGRLTGQWYRYDPELMEAMGGDSEGGPPSDADE
jgi:hypothetical protein